MTVVTWLGCDLVTGQIVEELQDLTPSGTISHRLGAYTSAAFQLPIPTAPRNWQAATEPGRSMIAAVLGGVPIWAGLVLAREGGSDAIEEISCMTLEGYLDRRFVADHTWTSQDEASVIAAGLIGDANTTEGIGLTVDAPATATLRDRTYKDRDDKTVYDALRELSGVLNGPEWTIVLGWTDATQTAVKKTIKVRKRIGMASSTPTAVFTTGSASAVLSTRGASDARYSYREDYTARRGANHIIAVSSGEGDSRPQSSPSRDEDLFTAGWPRYEHRFTPSTSITSTTVLDGHAQRALGLLSRGVKTFTIAGRADAYPVLGVDWTTGDDIGYELTGHRHPDGVSGVARAVGWELDPVRGFVAPILLGADS